VRSPHSIFKKGTKQSNSSAAEKMGFYRFAEQKKEGQKVGFNPGKGLVEKRGGNMGPSIS